MEELQKNERKEIEDKIIKKKKLIFETFEIFKYKETDQIHQDQIINFFNYLGRFIPIDILKKNVISELKKRALNLKEMEDKIKNENEIKKELNEENENENKIKSETVKNSKNDLKSENILKEKKNLENLKNNSEKSEINLKNSENRENLNNSENDENSEIDFGEEEIIELFKFEILEPIALDVLNTGNYFPDPILKLRECFFLLDPEKRGYIEKKTFISIFQNKEEEDNFSEEEMENFLKFVLSNKDQEKIYYENYCLDLKEYVENHRNKMNLNY